MQVPQHLRASFSLSAKWGASKYLTGMLRRVLGLWRIRYTRGATERHQVHPSTLASSALESEPQDGKHFREREKPFNSTHGGSTQRLNHEKPRCPAAGRAAGSLFRVCSAAESCMAQGHALWGPPNSYMTDWGEETEAHFSSSHGNAGKPP